MNLSFLKRLFIIKLKAWITMVNLKSYSQPEKYSKRQGQNRA
jgi:hypothetical protein